MTSLALLMLRVVVGGLLAGHGAQKLFGFSGGPGPEKTAAYMATLDLAPPKRWAFLAGASELVGGGLTLLGLLNPIGPLVAIASMTTATLTQHKDKPIWVTNGGAELPLTNIAVLAALMFAGPGKASLDAAFGTRVPWWFSFFTLTAIGVGIVSAVEPAPIALPAPQPNGEAVPTTARPAGNVVEPESAEAAR